MSKGRKRLPDQIKELRGTERLCRKKEDSVKIESATKMPPSPKILNKHGRRFWRNVGKMAIDLGLLHPANMGNFQLLSSEYGVYVEAQENMNKISDMIDTGTDKQGNKFTKVTAYRKISEKAFTNYMRMSVEFGLTPASVSNVLMTPKEKQADPMGEFL